MASELIMNTEPAIAAEKIRVELATRNPARKMFPAKRLPLSQRAPAKGSTPRRAMQASKAEYSGGKWMTGANSAELVGIA
jgi:hypothetical protein